MASASEKKGASGTVLLRQAEPKYKFVGRKLPKEPSESRKEMKSSEELKMTSNQRLSQDSTSFGLSLESNIKPTDLSSSSKAHQQCTDSFSSQGKKPIAVVGASFQSRSSNTAGSFPYDSLSEPRSSVINSRSDMPFTNIGLPVDSNLTISTQNNFSSAISLILPQSVDDTKQVESSLIDTSAAASALSTVKSSILSDRLAEVEKERNKLKKDLEAQLQVNSELKRLLVASVGDDLCKRVERLAQDRVQLSMDIGGFSKKITEDYENLDKMSIQADMWRSKYLASRVMVEELGNARAYFSLQLHESQEALQQMLNERHELRTNLLEAYKILQQVKDAFDPLNSHRSTCLPSTNILDLSRACQQLGEAVRYRLLPSHVANSPSVEIDLDNWENSVTRAEQYAHELLSRPSEPTGSLQSGSSYVLPVTASPPASTINRYHPQVKHENVNINCCKCKGEINVV